MRRVVVTGMGMVTPLACGVEATWSRLIAGKSGARKIDTFEVSDITCKIAGVIPLGDGTNGTYNPDEWMEPKEQRKVDKFIVYAMCVPRKQALEHAGWKPSAPDEPNTTSVMIGAGIGGVEGIAGADYAARARPAAGIAVLYSGPHRIAAGYVSIERWPRVPLRRRHGLLDRRPRHRRRQPPDRPRRRRRHGGRRLRDLRSTGFRSRDLPPCAPFSTSFNDTPTKASRPLRPRP